MVDQINDETQFVSPRQDIHRHHSATRACTISGVCVRPVHDEGILFCYFCRLPESIVGFCWLTLLWTRGVLWNGRLHQRLRYERVGPNP